MEISVSDAKARLTELVKTAEAGEEVVLTRHGKPRARIISESEALSRAERWQILQSFLNKPKINGNTEQFSSNHDFLYDERGLPR